VSVSIDTVIFNMVNSADMVNAMSDFADRIVAVERQRIADHVVRLDKAGYNISAIAAAIKAGGRLTPVGE